MNLVMINAGLIFILVCLIADEIIWQDQKYWMKENEDGIRLDEGIVC